MKFKIQNNKVYIEFSSKKTEIFKYPLNGITIFSIVKRLKERRSHKAGRPIGDNCPMLYAMKNADGLTTDQETIELLYSYAKQCLDDYIFEGIPFDAIILIPSKHDIGRRLALLLHQKFNIPIIDDFLKKKSPQQLLEDIKNDQTIPQSSKQEIRRALRNCSDSLSIKEISTKNRCYLSIFNGNHVKLPPNTEHVLLVDDISSSGSTFESASKVIKAHCKQVKLISAITLFSPIKSVRYKN
ncbi:hypothetical protein ACNO7O_10455 [Bisgaard Taxon 45]